MANTTISILDAHRASITLLDKLVEVRRLALDIWPGMDPGSERVDDIDTCIEELAQFRESAGPALDAHLISFAAVHEWTVTVSGQIASSAHQVTLKLVDAVIGYGWTTEAFRSYYEKYWRSETESMDWDASSAARDKTAHTAQRFALLDDWDEHRALLEMEIAKATRFAAVPVETPKLIDVERNILTALGDQTMTAEELSKAAGYPNNSNFRNRLPRMVEKGLLEKAVPHGYRCTPMSGQCQG